MQIISNEQRFEVKGESSFTEVPDQLDISGKGLAVAVNSAVVPHDSAADTS